jgi:hypothetical protein
MKAFVVILVLAVPAFVMARLIEWVVWRYKQWIRISACLLSIAAAGLLIATASTLAWIINEEPVLDHWTDYLSPFGEAALLWVGICIILCMAQCLRIRRLWNKRRNVGVEQIFD